jgi:hypothetical protein
MPMWVIIVLLVVQIIIIKIPLGKTNSDKRWFDLIFALIDRGTETSQLESQARKTLKALAKNRKQQIKALKEEMREMETFLESRDPSEDEDEEGEDDKDDEEASRRREKSTRKIESISIALMRRMRQAKEFAEHNKGKGISPEAFQSLDRILTTSFEQLEND